MIKARFSEEQKPVIIKKYGNEYYAFICLNAKIDYETVAIDSEHSETELYYEYDYNEFLFSDGELNVQDIMNNPEKYLEYPANIPTEIEQLRADVDYLLMLNE